MSRNINISNYEEFLIDFLDGTLDENTHAQVLLFLENNPDIADEFNGIEDVVVDECIGRINFKDELRIKLEPKILINTENYEHYFIAYHQGDLSNDEIIQVDDFLSENTQLQKEFDLFKVVSAVQPSKVVFNDKDSLKVVEFAAGEFMTRSEFENICIDYFEENLDSTTTNTLLDAIDNNKELEDIFNLYHNTKLKSDTSIVFEQKSKLYRRRIIAVVPAIQYLNSIAAAVLILLMFNVYNFNIHSLNIENTISHSNKIKKTTIIAPSIANHSSEIIDNTTLVEVDDEEQISSTVNSKHNYRTTTQNMAIANQGIVYVKPKDMNAGFISEDIKMENPTAINYIAAAKDTSYFEVTATELSDKHDLVEESFDNKVDKQTVPEKLKRKITRIINREKEYYANMEPKETLKKFTNYAVKSYNIMTEREEFVAKK